MLLCILGAFRSGLAPAADGYFAELGGGYNEITFTPEYSFVDGQPKRRFKDRAYGGSATLRGGYRFPFGDSFHLDLAGDLTYSWADWELSLPWEPARFRYDLPYSLGLSAAPGVELGNGLSLFAEIGLNYAYVREEKSSSVTTSYDHSEWVPGWLWGAGIRYRIDDRLALSLGYRRAEYQSLRYRSRLPDGSHAETIEDDPRSDTTTLALRYWF